MSDLRKIWNTLALTFNAGQHIADNLWSELEKAYSDKNRHYHNLDHLNYMFGKASKYKENIADESTLLFSIFFHDIVYNVHRHDNEEKSAEAAKAALTKLGLPLEMVTICQNQILATKDHLNPDNANDTNYLIDFDLGILGEEKSVYKDYVAKIRKEYSIYPDFIYNNGRKKVLQHFLNMEKIYKTYEFYQNHERRARENLKWELKEL